MAKDPEDDTSEEDPIDFSETEEGEKAREEWAKKYEDLDGAPEGDWDR